MNKPMRMPLTKTKTKTKSGPRADYGRRKPPAASAKRIAIRKEELPRGVDPVDFVVEVPLGTSSRTGRPTKEPVPGKKASLGLKVIVEVKSRLERAARASGRTQSQEAEARIERSFDREGLLSEVLSLAYGREIAGFLIMLGAVMKETASCSGARGGGAWLADRTAYREVEQAIMALLIAARPKSNSQRQSSETARFGPLIANQLIRTLRGDWNIMDEVINPFCAGADIIKSLIGPTAGRMIESLDEGDSRRIATTIAPKDQGRG